MNRALRRRHRRLWAVVVAALLIGGWCAVRQRAAPAIRFSPASGAGAPAPNADAVP